MIGSHPSLGPNGGALKFRAIFCTQDKIAEPTFSDLAELGLAKVNFNIKSRSCSSFLRWFCGVHISLSIFFDFMKVGKKARAPRTNLRWRHETSTPQKYLSASSRKLEHQISRWAKARLQDQFALIAAWGQISGWAGVPTSRRGENTTIVAGSLILLTAIGSTKIAHALDILNELTHGLLLPMPRQHFCVAQDRRGTRDVRKNSDCQPW